MVEWRNLRILLLHSVVPFPMYPQAPVGPPFLVAGEGRVNDWMKKCEWWGIRLDFDQQSSDSFPVKNIKRLV